MLQPLSGYGIGKVISSSDPEFVEGDLVAGTMNWEEYSLGYRLQKIETTELPLSYWLSALGNASIPYQIQSTLPSVEVLRIENQLV